MVLIEKCLPQGSSIQSISESEDQTTIIVETAKSSETLRPGSHASLHTLTEGSKDPQQSAVIPTIICTSPEPE